MTEDFPLGPADTITIRRFIRLKPTPRYGVGVYRSYFDTPPEILFENGWTRIGYSKKKPCCYYFRSPDPKVSGPFPMAVQIPSDDAIQALVSAVLNRHREGWHGKLGVWRGAFHPEGPRLCGTYLLYLKEEDRRIALAPMLSLLRYGVWHMTLRWHNGLDAPPTWQRTEYFSELVPDTTRTSPRLLSSDDGAHRQTPPDNV